MTASSNSSGASLTVIPGRAGPGGAVVPRQAVMITMASSGDGSPEVDDTPDAEGLANVLSGVTGSDTREVS